MMSRQWTDDDDLCYLLTMAVLLIFVTTESKYLMSSNKSKDDKTIAKLIMDLIEKFSRKKTLTNILFELGELALRLGIDEKEIMRLYVEAANRRDFDKFIKTDLKERILLLPHCLRPRDCPAKVGEFGYECINCRSDCVIFQLKSYAEKLGYKGVYILPGGALVEKILRKVKPKAVVGVACYKECVLGHVVLLKMGIIGQAIPLLRNGCVDTLVDVNKVKRVLVLKKKNL